eukprot:scaffold4328_cov135-Isochrysis_galbana.AAC.3
MWQERPRECRAVGPACQSLPAQRRTARAGARRVCAMHIARFIRMHDAVKHPQASGQASKKRAKSRRHAPARRHLAELSRSSAWVLRRGLHHLGDASERSREPAEHLGPHHRPSPPAEHPPRRQYARRHHGRLEHGAERPREEARQEQPQREAIQPAGHLTEAWRRHVHLRKEGGGRAHQHGSVVRQLLETGSAAIRANAGGADAAEWQHPPHVARVLREDVYRQWRPTDGPVLADGLIDAVDGHHGQNGAEDLVGEQRRSIGRTRHAHRREEARFGLGRI